MLHSKEVFFLRMVFIETCRSVLPLVMKSTESQNRLSLSIIRMGKILHSIGNGVIHVL